MSDQEVPDKDKSAQSDEDQIQVRLENIREGLMDDRIVNAVTYWEDVKVIDPIHARVDEYFLIFEEKVPVLHLEHAQWEVEKVDGVWTLGDWSPEDDIICVDVTKQPIPWDVLAKVSYITPEEYASQVAQKFADNFEDLFMSAPDDEPNPEVVVDPFVRRELETWL
jgi:hypothetical protein